MIVIEVLAGATGLVLFALAAGALWIGLLGALRLVRFDHCRQCGKFELVSNAAKADHACLRCRYGKVLHPVLTIHRAFSAHHGGLPRSHHL